MLKTDLNRLLQGCRQGEFASWRALAARYGPLLTQQFRHFRATHRTHAEDALRQFFLRLCSQDRLQGNPPSERVFRLELLFNFYDLCRNSFPQPDRPWEISDLVRIFMGVPFYSQKVIYLILCGYPKDTIQSILSIGPVLFYSAHECLQECLGGAEVHKVPLGLQDRERIRRTSSAHCDLAALVGDYMDGRVAWKEKAGIEAHVPICLCCLQDLCMAEESEYFLRSLKPLSETQTSRICPVGIGIQSL